MRLSDASLSMPPSISLVFPAWNEEAYVVTALSTALTVLSALSSDFEIIVVNDASTDRTEALALALAAKHPQIRVISHPKNLKLGYALRTGFAAARKDLICYSDIDLPFNLHEIGHALQLLNTLNADMICAYRRNRRVEGPRRVIYSSVYNHLVQSLFRIPIQDINFSFKLIRRHVLQTIPLQSKGSFIDAELVIRALRANFHIAQFGVDFFPRIYGKSTLSSPSVIAQLLQDMLRLYPMLNGTP